MSISPIITFKAGACDLDVSLRSVQARTQLRRDFHLIDLALFWKLQELKAIMTTNKLTVCFDSLQSTS